MYCGPLRAFCFIFLVVPFQVEQEISEYARNVLTAMGIENGPGHMEVCTVWGFNGHIMKTIPLAFIRL